MEPLWPNLSQHSLQGLRIHTIQFNNFSLFEQLLKTQLDLNPESCLISGLHCDIRNCILRCRCKGRQSWRCKVHIIRSFAFSLGVCGSFEGVLRPLKAAASESGHSLCFVHCVL